MLHEIRKEFRFEAAHRLPKLPDQHPCSRMHGHSYKVTVVVRGALDPDFGWVMDFGRIKQIAGELFEKLDHRTLNDVEGLENPTAEIIGEWIYVRLKPTLPELYQVILKETCTAESRYPCG